MKKIYIIGALKNKTIRPLAMELRAMGFDVFDDWHAAGKYADKIWHQYERERGRPYVEAIRGHHARCAFEFDMKNLNESDIAIVVAPFGKSAAVEMGWFARGGNPVYILLDKEPTRYDLMFQVATGIFLDKNELFKCLAG
jgi:hypothetical protein